MKKKIQKVINNIVNWKETVEILKWVYRMGSNFKRYMLGFLIINMVTMIISLGSSIAGRYVVDAATSFRSEMFFRCIIIMFSTTLVSIIISSVSEMFSSYVNEKYAYGIRAKMYDKVQRSLWHKLTKYHSGDLLSRLSGDVDRIASILITMAPNMIVTFCQLLIIVFILLKNDPVLVLIGMIIAPIGMITSVIFRKKYSVYQKALRESHSEYYAFMQESLSNINVTKTFQLEDENNLSFNNIRDKRMKLVMKSSVLSTVMSSFMRLIYNLGYVITFSWCAYNLTNSVVTGYTFGTMTLFLSLSSQLQGSMRSLGKVIPQMFSLFVSAKRLYEISEIGNEDYEEIEYIPKSVGLRVSDVSYSYDNDSESVLSNIDFEIPANSRVGIIGESGAGKTTFIRLLLSLIKPDSGCMEYILENGETEKPCPASRRFISYVPQGNTLLSGSIKTNLLSANKNATEEEMWKALEMADATHFINKMPQKLDSVLSESAGGISEGQAQRISIARALLRNKPVLILDEATSALDEKTESRIIENLKSAEQKTCFIITHRKSMLKYCDMVIEIDESGNATLRKPEEVI